MGILIAFTLVYLAITSFLTWLACVIFGWAVQLWIFVLVWFGIPALLMAIIAAFDTGRTRNG